MRRAAYRAGEALGDRVLLGTTLGGSPMALSMRDHQHRAIYFYGEYEPEIAALFRRYVRPGDVVFDIGANVGYFSVFAVELGARADAFEPNPAVRALLERTSSFADGAITVVPAACSDSPGTMPLYLSEPGNTGMTSLVGDSSLRSVQVAVTTVDEYAASREQDPDFIKIDVEGVAHEVLAGARATLRRAQPVVMAEVSSPATLDLMASFGYEAFRIRGDGSTVPHDGTLETVGGYENVLFTPAEARP